MAHMQKQDDEDHMQEEGGVAHMQVQDNVAHMLLLAQPQVTSSTPAEGAGGKSDVTAV